MTKERLPFALRYGPEYERFDQRLQNEIQVHQHTRFAKSLRDTRTNNEYLYDLIDGFLVEEKVENLLTDAGIDFRSSGGGGVGHVILPSTRVTQDFDYRLQGNFPIDLEVQSTVVDKQPLHIKEWKIERATAETLVLFYIKSEDRWYIVDTSDLEPAYFYDKMQAMCYPLYPKNLGPKLTVSEVQRRLIRRLNNG